MTSHVPNCGCPACAVQTKDALTLARQMSCGKHPGSIIKHISDSIPRCPFCGVSQGDWEAMETEMQWANTPASTPAVPARSWAYGVGSGPYPGSGNNSSNPLQDRELLAACYGWLIGK